MSSSKAGSGDRASPVHPIPWCPPSPLASNQSGISGERGSCNRIAPGTRGAGPLLPGLMRVEVARGAVSLDPGNYSWIDSASIIQRLTPLWQLWLRGWALIIQCYDLLHWGFVTVGM